MLLSWQNYVCGNNHTSGWPFATWKPTMVRGSSPTIVARKSLNSNPGERSRWTSSSPSSASLATMEPGTPGKWYQVGIYLLDGGKLIGDCGFRALTDDPEQVEIGMTLAPEFQGQGFATEAARALLDYLFADSGQASRVRLRRSAECELPEIAGTPGNAQRSSFCEEPALSRSSGSTT